MREDSFGQAISEHAYVPGTVHIHLEQEPSLLQIPIAGGETARGLSEKLNIGRGLFVAAFNLTPPKRGLQPDAPCQGRFFLNLQAMCQRCVSGANTSQILRARQSKRLAISGS